MLACGQVSPNSGPNSEPGFFQGVVMSTRNRFVLMFSLSALAVLIGCSSTNKVAPPPTGGFSDTDLNGTYVFSTSGSDAGGNFLTMVGTFNACGCAGGTISAGVVDVNDPSLPAPVVQDAITGGSYAVGVDGRAKLSLTLAAALPSPFQSSTITLDFVLSSGQHGLVTEFDGNGSGSGSLDLQSPSLAQTAGTFVFNLAGISGVSVTTGFGIPAATVGSVTLDASGNATGVQDLNNDSAYSALSIISPSKVLVGTSPSAATLVTGAGTFSFDVYAIDSTHMKFIETDTFPILVGDVFSQSSAAFPSGELAFTMAGVDLAAGPGPLAVGGMMNSNGTALSGGVEDFNDAGASNITSTSTTPFAFTGGITASGTGRYLVTFNSGFENGNNGNTTVPYTFAAYPSTGGTQLLEIDGLGLTGGAAYPQSSTSFASGQGYGLNLTGSNTSSEEDDIAEFTNTNNALKGLIDVNDEGGTQPPQNFTGTYAADSTNAGRALITSSAFNLTSYTLDGTNSIFIEIDNSQVGLGSIGQQASSAQGAIATRMAVLRPRSTARGASWKRKQAADDRSR